MVDCDLKQQGLPTGCFGRWLLHAVHRRGWLGAVRVISSLVLAQVRLDQEGEMRQRQEERPGSDQQGPAYVHPLGLLQAVTYPDQLRIKCSWT